MFVWVAMGVGVGGAASREETFGSISVEGNYGAGSRAGVPSPPRDASTLKVRGVPRHLLGWTAASLVRSYVAAPTAGRHTLVLGSFTQLLQWMAPPEGAGGAAALVPSLSPSPSLSRAGQATILT